MAFVEAQRPAVEIPPKEKKRSGAAEAKERERKSSLDTRIEEKNNPLDKIRRNVEDKYGSNEDPQKYTRQRKWQPNPRMIRIMDVPYNARENAIVGQRSTIKKEQPTALIQMAAKTEKGETRIKETQRRLSSLKESMRKGRTTNVPAEELAIKTPKEKPRVKVPDPRKIIGSCEEKVEEDLGEFGSRISLETKEMDGQECEYSMTGTKRFLETATEEVKRTPDVARRKDKDVENIKSREKRKDKTSDKVGERENVRERSANKEKVGSRKKQVEKNVRHKDHNTGFANERSVLPHRIKDHKKEPPDDGYRKEESRGKEMINRDDTRTRGGDETRTSRNKEEKKTDRLLQRRRRRRKQSDLNTRIERSEGDPQKYKAQKQK